MSPPHPPSRLVALGVAIAVALAAGACSGPSAKQADTTSGVVTTTASTGGLTTSNGDPAAASGASPAHLGGMIEGDLGGARVRLEQQPLVRAGSATVLTAVVTIVKTEKPFNLTSRILLSDLRLFLADEGVLASPAKLPNGDAAASRLGRVALGVGDAVGLRVVYGALPAQARSADVLWPALGVIPAVPLVDGPVPPLPPYGADPPRDVELAGITPGEVRTVTARSTQLGGAVATQQANAQTKVVLAADVLFALDKADLAPQANTALNAAAAAMKAAGPGPVKVTGHTDDQGTEQHNLDLSNRRAQTVATALGSRLPAGSYPLAVSGRGEAEAAVEGTTPEARAANRRVELVVERRQEAPPPTGAATLALPSGGGPSAKAADGLVFDQSDGSRVRLRGDKAVREGSWLRVDLTATADRLPPDGGMDLLLDLRDPGARSIYGRGDAAGVGVLDGAVLRLPAVVDARGFCACTDEVYGITIYGKEQQRLSLWVGAPSSVGSTVVVQLPRDLGRLLEVPVAPR